MLVWVVIWFLIRRVAVWCLGLCMVVSVRFVWAGFFGFSCIGLCFLSCWGDWFAGFVGG